MAKHMADLVKQKIFYKNKIIFFLFIIKVCKSIGLPRGAQYGK
jgi:hypothetical protein